MILVLHSPQSRNVAGMWLNKQMNLSANRIQSCVHWMGGCMSTMCGLSPCQVSKPNIPEPTKQTNETYQLMDWSGHAHFVYLNMIKFILSCWWNAYDAGACRPGLRTFLAAGLFTALLSGWTQHPCVDCWHSWASCCSTGLAKLLCTMATSQHAQVVRRSSLHGAVSMNCEHSIAQLCCLRLFHNSDRIDCVLLTRLSCSFDVWFIWL